MYARNRTWFCVVPGDHGSGRERRCAASGDKGDGDIEEIDAFFSDSFFWKFKSSHSATSLLDRKDYPLSALRTVESVCRLKTVSLEGRAGEHSSVIIRRSENYSLPLQFFRNQLFTGFFQFVLASSIVNCHSYKGRIQQSTQLLSTTAGT